MPWLTKLTHNHADVHSPLQRLYLGDPGKLASFADPRIYVSTGRACCMWRGAWQPLRARPLLRACLAKCDERALGSCPCLSLMRPTRALLPSRPVLSRPTPLRGDHASPSHKRPARTQTYWTHHMLNEFYCISDAHGENDGIILQGNATLWNMGNQ